MKKDVKKISGTEKNYYLYFGQYCFDGNFNQRMNEIDAKWNLPITSLKYKRSVNEKKFIQEFEKQFGLKAVYEFKKDLENLITDFNLGFHWLDCLGIFFLTGKLTLPPSTFSIIKDLNKKRIILNLGPYTTLEDIKLNWHKIELVQQQVWPIKKIKTSNRSLDNLFIYFKSLAEKYKTSQLNKKTGEYETIPDDERRKRDYGIIANLFENEEDDSTKADKRRVDRLRQIRRRHRKKMT